MTSDSPSVNITVLRLTCSDAKAIPDDCSTALNKYWRSELSWLIVKAMQKGGVKSIDLSSAREMGGLRLGLDMSV